MTNAEVWKDFKEYTIELSTNCRKLGYVAAAICWLFKKADYSFPPAIYMALGFIVFFFIFDLFQYLVASLVLRTWISYKENKYFKANGSLEGDYSKPKWLDSPAFVCWCIKIFTLSMGYCFIICHLYKV